MALAYIYTGRLEKVSISQAGSCWYLASWACNYTLLWQPLKTSLKERSLHITDSELLPVGSLRAKGRLFYLDIRYHTFSGGKNSSTVSLTDPVDAKSIVVALSHLSSYDGHLQAEDAFRQGLSSFDDFRERLGRSICRLQHMHCASSIVWQLELPLDRGTMTEKWRWLDREIPS